MKILKLYVCLLAVLAGGMLSTIKGQEYNVKEVGDGHQIIDNYFLIMKKGNGWTLYYLYDAENNIVRCRCGAAKDGGEGLLAVVGYTTLPDENKLETKWGFMDKEGNWVIEPQFNYNKSLNYERSHYFVKGHALVGLSETEVGIIDKQGNIISRFSSADYKNMRLINDELIWFSRNNKVGLMNLGGKIVIEPIWYDIRLLKNNMILVQKNYKNYGLYGINGNLILEAKFNGIGDFYHGLSLIKKGSKYGYVNNNGDIVIPIQYKDAYSFIVPFAKTDKGIIDTTGRITDIEDIGYEVYDGLIRVKNKGKWGYMNENGEIVIEPQFDECWDFKNGGYAVVSTNGQDCVIDKSGNIIVKVPKDYQISFSFKYNNSYNFKEGYIPIYKSGHGPMLFGFIDTEGNIVIEPRFEDAEPFEEGLARVKKNGLWGYIDKKGKMVIEPQFEYDPIHFSGDTHINGGFIDGLACVKRYGTYSVIDKTGAVLLPWKSEKWKKIGKHSFILSDGDWASPLVHIKVKEKSETVLLAEQQAAKEQQKTKSELERYVEKGMEAYTLPTMTDYIKPKVEKEINTWQKKDEFESTAKWKVRVNEQTRNAKIETLTAKYKKEYQTKVDDYKARCNALVKEFYVMKEKKKRDAINLDRLKLSLFDADNESFMITGLPDADILLSVKTEEAPNFKQRWETIKKTATFKYVPNGDQVTLVSVTFTNGQKKYTYDGKSDVKYGVTDVEYNFKPLELAMEENIEYNFDALEGVPTTTVQSLAQNKTKVEHKKVSVGNVSDVDKTIPNTYTNNSNTFAVIIGNENYQKVSKVQFAGNDAGIFAQYCKLTLGLPDKNIRCYNDATYATMLSAVKDIKSIAQAYKGNLNVLFYYAGHGVPNESSNDAFLLPIDTDGRSTEVCYPLSKLYQELGSMNAKSVVVFMDACFSGAQRGEGMLASARGVAIMAKPAAPQGNMVVFSAASGDETAYPYKEKNHGLFTYFLLKKLQETKGAVTLGELGNYIIDNVTKESVVSNGKSQTPTVSTSMSLDDSWREQKLK